jgi:hypothetical protein
LDVTHYLFWVFPRVRQDMNFERAPEGVSNDAAGNDLRKAIDLTFDRLDIKSRDPLLRHWAAFGRAQPMSQDT